MITINIFKEIAIKVKIKKLIKQPIDEQTKSLIKNTLELLPEAIDFSDGELSDDNGFYAKSLANVFDVLENINTPPYNSNIDFMPWAIYGVLHRKCRQLFICGTYSIKINELDYNEINKEYIKAYLEAE